MKIFQISQKDLNFVKKFLEEKILIKNKSSKDLPKKINEDLLTNEIFKKDFN